MTRIGILAGLLLILGLANYSIYQREQLRAHGQLVYLELAPVDPRSLMQGDYMALSYQLRDLPYPPTDSGTLIVSPDPRRLGRPARWNSPAGLGELPLKFRLRQGRVVIGTDAFFFEEGTAATYRNARYGEFRVAPDGAALLTGLRDENLQPLGPR